ncbi:MAG: FecR domain-containing protein [Polyangia bacterium]
MSRIDEDCARAAEIDRRLRDGEPVGESELRTLERHLASCESCRLERAALEEIAADGSAGPLPELDELARRRLAEGVLDAVEEKERLARGRRSRAGSWRLALAAAAGAAAAALVLVLVLVGTARRAPQPAPPAAGRDEASVPAAPPAVGSVAAARGEVRRGFSPAAVDGELVAGDVISTGAGDAALGFEQGVAAALARDTRLRIEPSAGARLSLALEAGEVLVAVDPRAEAPPVEVLTEHGRVRVAGTVFAVLADEAGAEVRVLRGAVETAAAAGSFTRRVESGRAAALGGDAISRPLARDELTAARARLDELAALVPGVDAALVPADERAAKTPERDDADTRASTAGRASASRSESFSISAGELQRLARDERLAGNWPAAAAAYRELIRTHPSSEEARTAQVSLGQIELEKLGRPGAALRSFERYLGPDGSGPLALEALWGKARALGALKLVEREREALTEFVERFPGAIQARGARRRLAELR